MEHQKNERRQQVMESGLALDFERVDQLKRVGHFLIDQIYEQGEDGTYHNIWLPDVKQIGSGNSAERVDIERFNAAIIGELRGVLDDLAKETGGRIKGVDVTSGGQSLFDLEEWKRKAQEQRQAIEQMEEPGCGSPDA